MGIPELRWLSKNLLAQMEPSSKRCQEWLGPYGRMKRIEPENYIYNNILDQSVVDAVLTDANTCERAVLKDHLKGGALYTADRNYGADYSFFQIFLDALCDYVIRIKNNAIITELESF